VRAYLRAVRARLEVCNSGALRIWRARVRAMSVSGSVSGRPVVCGDPPQTSQHPRRSVHKLTPGVPRESCDTKGGPPVLPDACRRSAFPPLGRGMIL
jgi:hypothetical protein